MLHVLTAFHQQSLGGSAPQISQQGRKYDHYLIVFSAKSARQKSKTFFPSLFKGEMADFCTNMLMFNFVSCTLVVEIY